uniref:DDE Tnp4 domain-containing protein n=1 Tax=Nothobranchius furzeri TaxID=105023 RepID=A0A8C6MEF6_NOTFU
MYCHLLLQRMKRLILKTGTEWEVLLYMDENTFARHFRVTRPQFEYLTMKLHENGVGREHHQGLLPVPVTKKVLMFLWYMANQNSFREMSDKFDVSQSAAHQIIVDVLKILCTLGSNFVSWPNACEKATSALAFQRLCGTGVIGAIEGCHIKEQKLPVQGVDYMNRMSFLSVLLQGIVDDRGRFLDICAGPPGRVHDARMLRASPFFESWQEKMAGYSLLGDCAYIRRDFPFVVTPRRNNGTLTCEEQLQSNKISCGRVVVEQAFGQIKCMWRRLRDLQNTSIKTVVMIIMAACFLHNMTIADLCQLHPRAAQERMMTTSSVVKVARHLFCVYKYFAILLVLVRY